MARARRGNLDIQRNGFLATLVVAVTSATLLLSALGLFRLPNDLLFDAAVRIGLGERGVESTVLLVETTADPAGGDPAVWSRMLDELRRLGARRVVFTFDPALPGGGGEDVVIGHPGRPSERQPGAWTLAPSPNALAAAVIPAATYGIHRRQATAVATEEGGMVPTIEAWAAGLTPVSSGEVFLVRFGRSADDLPRVGIGRVLDGGLVATLVEGRTVLVGPGGTVAGRGLNTPITPDLAALTPLEFHAFATGSLLAGAAIRDVGWLGTAALPLVFSLAGAVVYRRASPRSALWLALGLPLPILLVAFVALLWADRMLP
ncbi:MAG TPA: hypothetical protein VEB64_01580, partial [Azospirillaceae bacterium]|nr:hypothetical protein [Azospirillaceae bacterium]